MVGAFPLWMFSIWAGGVFLWIVYGARNPMGHYRS